MAPVIVLLIALSAIMNTSAAPSVGALKKGDWVEYTVTHTGTIPE